MEIGVPFLIVSRLSGLALTANCLNEGASLYTKQIEPGYSPQVWTLTKDGTLDVGSDGYCIDISNANKSPGGFLILWRKHGGTNQKWDLKDSYIISKHSSLLSTLIIDVSNENTKYNASVTTWTMNKPVTLNQLWDFVPAKTVTKEWVKNLDAMYEKCRTLMYQEHMLAIEVESKYDLSNPSLYIKGSMYDFLNPVKGNGGNTMVTILHFNEKSETISGVLTFNMGSDKVHILVYLTSKGERKMNVSFNSTEKEGDLFGSLINGAKTELNISGKAKVSAFMSTGTKVYCKVRLQ